MADARPPASAPSPNGANGQPSGARDRSGRFTKGNGGGPGNPHGRASAAIRLALLNAITPADIAAIGRKLVERATSGNLAAIKLLLAYTCGPPPRILDDAEPTVVRVVVDDAWGRGIGRRES